MKIVTALQRATLVVGLAVMWLACAPGPVFAQAAAPGQAKAVSGLGYGFFGIGAATCCGESTGTFHFGGGGEAVLRDAFGIGAEIGYIAPWEESSDGVGAMSINGTFHFFPNQPSRKARPFLTGGYTLGFDEGVTENLFNFGGGVDYWMTPKVGLRIELRDHVWSEGGDTMQFWGVRFGVTIR